MPWIQCVQSQFSNCHLMTAIRTISEQLLFKYQFSITPYQPNCDMCLALTHTFGNVPLQTLSNYESQSKINMFSSNMDTPTVFNLKSAS